MSSATSLKEELYKLKNRLETIEEQLTSQSNEIESREGKWAKIEPNLNYVIGTQGDRIKLNIGGKLFTTSVNTILTIRDSFLARLIESGKVDLKEELFFDRTPKVFPLILNFYRYKKIEYKKLSKNDLILLKDDAEYFAISEISNFLTEKLKEPEIVSMETGGEYIFKGNVVGTNKFSDLNDKNLSSGVCSTSPGKIIVELNTEYDIKSLDIGGYSGDSANWYPDNGANAKIFFSTDKIKWEEVGKVPSGFGKAIKNVKLSKGSKAAKYIKFESNSYLGLGYIKAYKVEEFN